MGNKLNITVGGGGREKYNLKKNAEICPSTKNLLGFTGKALEWRRFVKAQDARAERRGNSSALKEKRNRGTCDRMSRRKPPLRLVKIKD